MSIEETEWFEQGLSDAMKTRHNGENILEVFLPPRIKETAGQEVLRYIAGWNYCVWEFWKEMDEEGRWSG